MTRGTWNLAVNAPDRSARLQGLPLDDTVLKRAGEVFEIHVTPERLGASDSGVLGSVW